MIGELNLVRDAVLSTLARGSELGKANYKCHARQWMGRVQAWWE